MNAPLRFTAQGTSVFEPEDVLDNWRTTNRRNRSFGLVETPFPPINGETAMRLLRLAYDAAFRPGGPDKAEYRREVEAIQRARDAFSTKRDPKVQAILDRDGSDCWLCGEPLGEDITKEHRVPRSRGGSDDLTNLVLAHRACNRLLADAPAHVKDAVKRGRTPPATMTFGVK